LAAAGAVVETAAVREAAGMPAAVAALVETAVARGAAGMPVAACEAAETAAARGAAETAAAAALVETAAARGAAVAVVVSASGRGHAREPRVHRGHLTEQSHFAVEADPGAVCSIVAGPPVEAFRTA
jgi:hypothetical protein